MKNQQSGFTLIELIIVIVILGILAAFALPRFADMSGDARKATLEGAAGSMRSASAIAHSAYLAAGTAPGTVTLEGAPILLAFGYPTLASIMTAAQISPSDFDTSVPGTVTAKSAADATKCKIVYVQATSTAIAPTITVTASNTDC